MNVAFYHIEQPTQASEEAYVWARGLVQSVRRHMPLASILHLTDMTSRKVKGVDAVRRKPSEPMALLRMRHQAGLRGDWLFVDTDVIVERSVEWIFGKFDFDIAITRRNWDHLKPATGFTERMPFNTGVMFSRCPHFFAEAYSRLRLLSKDSQHWMGDQEVINDMLNEDRPRYVVKYLSGQRFNFPPHVKDPEAKARFKEAMKQVHITHYKGALRKSLLMRRLKDEAKVCA